MNNASYRLDSSSIVTMIADTLVSVTSALLSKWQLGLTIFLLFVAACTYTLTACLSSWARRDTKDGREPPTVPYFVPFLGGFFAFATDTKGFIDRARYYFLHMPTKYLVVAHLNPLARELTKANPIAVDLATVSHTASK